ncbi:MAG: hypothetical protein QW265_02385 [Candidatus Bathyarchaeia archaeon]
MKNRGFSDELLRLEKHEDEMITSMVRLMKANEELNERINRLTLIMLILTWITLIISIPNTLATFFGIPKISEILELEVIVSSVIVSTIVPIVTLLWIGFDLRKITKDKRQI